MADLVGDIFAATNDQVGLLKAEGLPVAGVETARKVVDPTLPSNELMSRWATSSAQGPLA